MNLFWSSQGRILHISFADGLEEGKNAIDEKEEEIEEETNNDDTVITLAHFKDTDFLYTEEGEYTSQH